MKETETAAQPKSTFSTKKARKYVQQRLQRELPEGMIFHDWEHTSQVRRAAKKLMKEFDLNGRDKEVVELAAIFHDVGYIKTYEDHEEESKRIAEAYLREHGYPEEQIQRVQQLIEATRGNHEPQNLLEKIIRDADVSHLGEKKYRARAERLRQERNQFLNKDIDRMQWHALNAKFLAARDYHTPEAERIWGDRKNKNQFKSADRREEAVEEVETEGLILIEDSKSARMMFKTALRNHIDLTSIADNKANIMLSLNTLILAVGMPAAAKWIDGSLYLLIPALFLLTTAIVTIFYATVSTRPIKMDGDTNLRRLEEGKSNLFFFGNFYNLKQQQYQENIRKIIADNETLDDSIINDLYFLGMALGDKFARLRTCYNVFMIGMITTFASFLISYFVKFYL